IAMRPAATLLMAAARLTAEACTRSIEAAADTAAASNCKRRSCRSGEETELMAKFFTTVLYVRIPVETRRAALLQNCSEHFYCLTHNRGWRIGLLRIIFSTSGSGGRVCHSLTYSEFESASPAKSKPGWRMGQYWKYSTSGRCGQAALF